MEQIKNRFVIIDGSSLMYRAFFALPLLTTESGKYTNAIFGFAKMAVKILEELKPEYAAVAFDKSRHTFRSEIYKEYKGTREKTPDELSSQIPMLHEFTKALGIKLIEIDNYEADDIIGTLANKAAREGFETMVITGDRDILQLIQPNLQIVMTKKGITETEIMDETAFKEKYAGLSPKRLIDMKALMGDKSDNIPGVFGIGEKTALKLLTQYQTLDGIYEHINEITAKKLKEKLVTDKDNAYLSYKLATIVCDMPLDFIPTEYSITPDSHALKKICEEYALKSVWTSLNKISGIGEDTAVVMDEDADKYLVANKNMQQKVISQIQTNGYIAYLPVCTGKVPHITCHGLMIASSENNQAVNIFISEADLTSIAGILADKNITKITYDLKSSLHSGLTIAGKTIDTMLAAYMLDPSANEYNLENLSDKYLEREIASYDQKEAIPFGKTAYLLKSVPLKELADILLPLLQEKNLTNLYDNTELPLEKVLANMENIGVYINSEKLQNMSDEIGSTIETLLTDIYKLADIEFNVNSPKQLGEVLFDHLKLPVQKKTKTGYSTNADVLDALRPYHPIIEKILEYRMWSKLKSTYLDGMYNLIDADTQRIHTTFNQTVTATGRLSSSEPNLQNIPVRTDAGKKIRSLFEPAAGYDIFLSADYSQIELRILAHMSDDKNFVEAFKLDQDIHARTASEIFDVPLSDVTADLRRHAKAINFGLVYGKSDYGLAQELNIPRKEAATYIKNYFTKYEGVKKCLDKIVTDAHEDGYTTTLFGRRRYLPGIKSKNFNIRNQNERMAMNTPIQGTAADIIKMAMIATWQEIKKQNLKSRILLQVHDELVIEAVNEEIDILKSILINTMQNIVKLSVPLTIDINTGKNWAEAK
ncbi:DNA polymerase I [Pectinatus brassicae]|uniref:DNA polymerase I n=1 Tax=Pectinatus brassicae TaxID=862415 RepID=A0A840UEK3_9FIRM|nr:DNA polymerase I [Pectinatus brassicae]MBB5336141.1 DNA polymerase-1 [Pectinatus brassicae]